MIDGDQKAMATLSAGREVRGQPYASCISGDQGSPDARSEESRFVSSLLFLAEVVGIDPSDGVGRNIRYADTVVDHQVG